MLLLLCGHCKRTKYEVKDEGTNQFSEKRVTYRFPPRRFFGPSPGTGRALMTFDGGGAASLSMCFSILSRKPSPYVPTQVKN